MNKDIGYKIENLVLLHLLRLYDKVFAYKVRNVDIDFIAIKNGKTVYFQVTQYLFEINEKNTN
jgi:predicted AAA+ superfamily ATPase